MAQSKILNFLSLDYLGLTYTEDEILAAEAAYEADEQRLKAEAKNSMTSAIEKTTTDYEGSAKSSAFQPDLFDFEGE